MKKILLALILVVFLATSVSALEALGGRFGIGSKYLMPAYMSGWKAMITYDPSLLPNLQVRLSGWGMSGSHGESTESDISLGAIWRLGDLAAMFVPYLGIEAGVKNWWNGSTDGYNRQYGYFDFGVEWKVIDQLALYANIPIVFAYTQIDDDGETLEEARNTYFFDWNWESSLTVGMVLFLD